MLLKASVYKKLAKVIKIADQQADRQIAAGEDMMEGDVSFAAIGFATGARFVRDMILDEFDFLFPDDDTPHSSDGPVTPFHYIDSNKTLFRDKHGYHYFWDESGAHWHGPYRTTAEACEGMREYNKVLNSKEDGA